jgi:hypothetical protein
MEHQPPYNTVPHSKELKPQLHHYKRLMKNNKSELVHPHTLANFEVFLVVSIKIQFFWDIMLCWQVGRSKLFWDNAVSYFFLEILALENEDTMLPLKH